nr:MAG TPA: acetyltransferase [Caudoviricetes sp.]
MMYETGGLTNWLPNIQEETESGRFQYAIVNSDGKLLGYLDYHIDWYSSCASRFGLISFDRGNLIVGKDLYSELNKLIYEYKLHRIEWRMIGGNPVEKHYDKFCEKYNGTKHILKDAIKDKFGNYHNDIIYEIIL